MRKCDSYDPIVFTRLLDGLPSEITRVGLTGGEPFLFPARLLEHVSSIRKSGRAVSVVTNGFWMGDRIGAESLVKQLADAGLGVLAVSLDDYHRPLPLLDDVRFCLHVASQFGIWVKVKGTGRAALEMEEIFVEEGLCQRTHGAGSWSSLELTGEARDLDADQPASTHKSPDCLFALDPVVWPDGRLVACCSSRSFDFDNDVLNRGNILQEDLAILLDRYFRDYLVAALITLGPCGLAKIAETNLSSRLTQCQACLFVLDDRRKIKIILREIEKNKELRKEIVGRALLLPQTEAAKAGI